MWLHFYCSHVNWAVIFDYHSVTDPAIILIIFIDWATFEVDFHNPLPVETCTPCYLHRWILALAKDLCGLLLRGGFRPRGSPPGSQLLLRRSPQPRPSHRQCAAAIASLFQFWLLTLQSLSFVLLPPAVPATRLTCSSSCSASLPSSSSLALSGSERRTSQVAQFSLASSSH